MVLCRILYLLVLISLTTLPLVPTASAENQLQSTQFRVGGYFPASTSFDAGSGFDLAYVISPTPFSEVETAIGYYRAEDGITGFISAVPLTLSARGVLPLPYINVHAGGGIGTYYKMAGGTTELPADHSEFSFGYHAGAGIEFTASSTLSLLLDGKYVVVDQGKFKSYDIKHGGTFLYGGFALKFH